MTILKLELYLWELAREIIEATSRDGRTPELSAEELRRQLRQFLFYCTATEFETGSS